MFTVPGSFPRAAIQRIRSQTPVCSPLQSCQQEVYLRAHTYAALSAYLATPGNSCFVEITDADQILPYTTLTIYVDIDAPAGADNAYTANLWLEATDTTEQLAAARMASQMNAWIATYAQQFADLRSAHAIAPVGRPGSGSNVHNQMLLFMPWGMLGEADIAFDGPDGAEYNGEAFAGNPGVDNPLVYGILGRRRHMFRVNYPFRDDYYGSVQIG